LTYEIVFVLIPDIELKLVASTIARDIFLEVPDWTFAGPRSRNRR
jgi:hypothetical protein